MVLFFKDPLASHAHEVDINMLLHVHVHNVPIATNEATAQLLLNRYRIAIIEISIFTFFGKHDT
jgi:methylglyoxal synthase